MQKRNTSSNPTQVKRIFNYANPLYERMKLRQLKKVEMVDAWTQTSDNGSDNEPSMVQKDIKRQEMLR